MLSGLFLYQGQKPRFRRAVTEVCQKMPYRSIARPTIVPTATNYSSFFDPLNRHSELTLLLTSKKRFNVSIFPLDLGRSFLRYQASLRAERELASLENVSIFQRFNLSTFSTHNLKTHKLQNYSQLYTLNSKLIFNFQFSFFQLFNFSIFQLYAPYSSIPCLAEV